MWLHGLGRMAPLARSEWEQRWYRCVGNSEATLSDAKKVPLTALSLSGRQVAYSLFSEKLGSPVLCPIT